MALLNVLALFLLLLLVACSHHKPPPVADLHPAGCEYRAGVVAGELVMLGNTLLEKGSLAARGIYVVNGVIAEIGEPAAIAKKYPAASQLRCRNSFFSPGLINAHEHTSYSHQFPSARMAHDYQHREEWNAGGTREIKPASKRTDDSDEIIWVELRHLLSGVTTLVGSGQVDGVIKNINTKYDSDLPLVDLMTFPFNPQELTKLKLRCMHSQPGDAAIALADNFPASAPYVPHVGEGINCLAEQEVNTYLAYATNNPTRKYSLIHGVMIQPEHYQLLKNNNVSVIWSPRSNVALYGKSLDPIPLLDKGISVALGTDWSPSGSYNMFEEMRCAKAVTAARSARTVTDVELWQMATQNAAEALGVDDRLGSIAVGKAADIVVFSDAQQRGLANFSSKKVSDVMAVLVNGNLLVAERGRVQGEWIENNCRAQYGDKSICIDFEKNYHKSFADIVQKNSANVDLLALDKQVSCDVH